MRLFTFAVAIAWWAQGLLCVLPIGPSHAHVAAADAHHHESAPAAPHHGQDAPDCAEHCASLARAIAPHAAQPDESGSALLGVAFPAAAGAAALGATPFVGARDRSPPDLAQRNRTLRL